MFENKIKKNIGIIKNLKESQKQNIKDNYTVGMYNGLELALSVMEEREPEFITFIKEPEVKEVGEQNGRTIASGVRKKRV